MGSFDTLAAVVPCPGCGIFYWESCQTKFFSPDPHEQGYLHPGEGKPIDYAPSEIDRAELWDQEWLRIGEHVRPGVFTLLLQDWELRTCFCGARLVPLAHLEVRSMGKDEAFMTFVALELCDLRRPETMERIDFIDDDWHRAGAGSSWQRASFEALAAEPRRARREAMAASIQTYLAQLSARDSSLPPGWTWLEGPARCESCGIVLTADSIVLITHPELPPFFGDAWPGGKLSRGTRISSLPAGLAVDRLRSRFYRLRDPSPTGLVLLYHRASFGCSCGAGRASLVTRFSRHADSLVLEEITWRAVRSRADLTGVDWIETSSTRYLERPEVTLEAGLACVLAERDVSGA